MLTATSPTAVLAPRLRVAFNGLFLHRQVGTGRYSTELLRAARHAARAGEREVDWLVLRPDGAASPPRWVRGENAIKLWFEQTGFPGAARRLGSDLLHYPYFAAPLRSRVPIVVTVHDVIPLVLPEYRGSPLVRAYMELQRVAVRRARLVLTDSNASRHDVVRVLDVPRQRVRVVPLGIDPAYRPRPDAEVAAVRARHRLPDRYILHASGLDVRKNVERLILAYSRARAGLGVVEPLAITGDPDRQGALFPPLRPLVERLDLLQHVRFLGVVAEDELPALYSGSALTVVASRYEGFGLPVLEAMASGAVVACSSASSLPEVAGDAALMFDPDDEEAIALAIARCLGDEELRGTLRERGTTQAAPFTWEKTAAATLEAYADACA